MAFQNDSIFWVEVHKIVPNPFQPRREFSEETLQELAESIRMYGILQPLTVSRKEIQREDGAFHTEYELIAGERRLRASRLAGLSQVPVIIREGEQSEQEKLEIAIIENLQREDLNAVDRAFAFKQLAEQFSLSHAKIAKKLGRSREYVSNSIRLLLLPEYMLDSLRIGDISEGHARTLLMLNDRPEELDTVYREILLKKLSVREVERIVRKIAQDKVRSRKWKDIDPELIELEKMFTESLGTRVQIQTTDYGGRLTIDYFSSDDLNKLLGLVRGEETTDFQDRDRVVEQLEALNNRTPLHINNENSEQRPEAQVTPVVPDNTSQVRESESEAQYQPQQHFEETRVEVQDEPRRAPRAVFLALEYTSPVVTPVNKEQYEQAPESVGRYHSEDDMPQTTDTEEQSVPSPAKEEDESDLYTIRNFTI